MSIPRYLLVLACASMGCAGPPASIHPSVGSASRFLAAEASGVPAEALGVYQGEGSPLIVALQRFGQRLFIIVPERRAVALKAEKTAGGFSLSAPPELMNAPDDAQQLPSSFSLAEPSSERAHWQLDSRLGSLVHRPNPFALELAANLRGLELVGLNDEGVSTRERLEHDLWLLREQPAKELQELVDRNSPELLQYQGGVLGYLSRSLESDIDDLRAAASEDESLRLQRYVEAVRRAPRGGPLWPPSDDAWLFELAARQLFSADKSLTFPDGNLLSFGSIFGEKVTTCKLGVILPEPTENRSRPWTAFARPAPGTLSAFSYVGLVLQSGPAGTCQALEPGRDVYPVEHGVTFFRLLADSRAQPRGVMFVGYMTAALFVTRSTAVKDLTEVVRALE